MENKDLRKKGKVAQILNTRDLVINIGEKNGVEVGMKFDVIDPKGEKIKDPDTQEIIGSLDRPKVRVKVIQVKENISVASTFKVKEINVGGTGGELFRGFSSAGIFAQDLRPPKWIKVTETLKTTETTWEDLSSEESYVKIGDPVIQVLMDEEEISEISE